MKVIAPLILLGVAAGLFLGVMGTGDAAAMGRGGFFNLATPFVLLYGLLSIALKKYRANQAVVCFVPLLIMVFTPACRVFAHFSNDLATLAPRVGGWFLFGLATIDVIIGYLPWRRQVETKQSEPHEARRE